MKDACGRSGMSSKGGVILSSDEGGKTQHP